MHSSEFDNAVIIYLGFGTKPHPGSYKEELAAQFGVAKADKLEEQINQLIKVMGTLKPDWSVLTLHEAGEWAKNEMAKKHPELSRQTLDALAWAFTWWWK